MIDLFSTFESLKRPPASPTGQASFSSQTVPGYPLYKIGKSDKGLPALLISPPETGGKRPLAPIKLENLSVQYGVKCVIAKSQKTPTETRFSVLSCLNEDKVMHAYFLQACGSLIRMLGNSPPQERLFEAINYFAELFRSLSLPAKKTVQGLWAELFLIYRSAQPRILAKAWRQEPVDRFDFSLGDQRVEVKSSSSRQREHHFSLEQLTPISGAMVIFASIIVERSGGGSSISVLMEKIRGALEDTPELAFRTDRIVADTLGRTYFESVEDRFDIQMAEGSIRFYAQESIPSITTKLPPQIKNVRFISDLSGVDPLDSRTYQNPTSLFAAAMQLTP